MGGGLSITCPRCGFISYHRDDVAQGYCGRCHLFHDEMVCLDCSGAPNARLGAARCRCRSPRFVPVFTADGRAALGRRRPDF